MSFSKFCMLGFVVLTTTAWGEAKKLICDPDSNVCSIPVVENYCGSDGVAKTKLDIGSGTYILSCECDCTSQENIFWLVKENGEIPKVKTIEMSKVVSAIDLVKHEAGVPDIFGVVPYCAAPKVKVDSLVYLQKIPSPDGAPQPYCYSIDESSVAESCSTPDCTAKENRG